MAYPCGNCGKNCTRMCVFCEKCESWFHNNCQSITKNQFLTLKQSKNCDYICVGCCETVNNEFDYELSLKRLESYANRNLLTEGVQVEEVLLRNEKHRQIINEANHIYSAQSCMVEDSVSRQILHEHKMSINDRKPIQVSMNGNCLFNALSVDIVGNESLANRLRVLMLQHQYWVVRFSQCIHPEMGLLTKQLVS